MKNEPVLTAGALSGIIMAGLAMAVSLGWLRLDEAQMGSIQTFLVALLALAVPVVGALIARRFVTPTANPKTETGEPALLIPAAQAQMLGLVPLGDDPDAPDAPEADPLPRWEAGRNLR